MTLLHVSDLSVEFAVRGSHYRAVSNVSFEVARGEVLGLVGESGSGKTASVLAILRLLPEPPGRVVGGRAHFLKRDLLAMSRPEMRRVRGAQIGCIFQDATTALNPVHRIGSQLAEAVRAHDKATSSRQVRDRAYRSLEEVGLPDVGRALNQYPHELSGGMRQRVMIAMALINRPQLVIADEPTTALDVTIQSQVLDVLRAIKRSHGVAMIIISHDLGVIAEVADKVAVMYAGRIVETGSVFSIFDNPRHPYTAALQRSVPRPQVKKGYLSPIEGAPPSVDRIPSGCAFHPRCAVTNDRALCKLVDPQLVTVGKDHFASCHFMDDGPYGSEGIGT